MKRWLVSLLVLLAVIVVVSPGIIGRLAEDNLEHAFPRGTGGDDDYVVTQRSFERGWFVAEGRHRVEIRHGYLHDVLLALTGLEPDVAPPAVIVNTRIDHGLVPVTSLSRESGTLRPALASTVSTLTLHVGDGDPIAIPGKLHSNISLTGDTASRYLLESGSFEDRDLTATWKGADVSFTIDAAGRSADYQGRVEPFVIRSRADTLRADSFRFEGELDKTDAGLQVGSFTLEGGPASAGTDSSGTAAVEALSLGMDSGLDEDERLHGTAGMTLRALDLPGEEPPMDLKLELAVDRIHGRALAALLAQLREAQVQAAGGHAASLAPAALETGLQRLLSAGGELRVDRLEVAMPEGKVIATFRFELPETDAAAAYSWASLLLGLSASADLELAAPLAERLLQAHPDLQSFLALGFLQRKGDVYVMEAVYAQGIVTVNGAPMPLPLPGREAPGVP